MEEKLNKKASFYNESLEKLNTVLEAQIRTVQNQIRKEEVSRAQQELILKSDITKLAEQLRNDYEAFKSQQNQLTEKITEMIKLEVDTRLACDTENRALNEAAIKRMIEEFGVFKEAIERQNKIFAKDLKESNAENSERANFLSRYIDEQIKKLEEQIDEQLKKIKVLCAKLTIQIKDNFKNEEENIAKLTNQIEENKRDLDKRIEALNDDYNDSMNEIEAWRTMKKIEDIVSSNAVYEALNDLSKEALKRITNLETLTETLSTAQIQKVEKCDKQSAELAAKTTEEIDRKIQALMERLSGENISQWNQSVKLTEKVMSPEGVKDTLDSIPPQVLQMSDIKKALHEISEGDQGRPKLVGEVSQI